MKDVALCYSMKDRVAFSKKTLPAVLKDADKFDLFIVDGSATQAGKDYACDLNADPRIAGVHCNVTGGADVAIVYALSFMLERNYDYCGLIENDVVLEEGWFDRIFALFGPQVGAVSARCYADRLLARGNGRAGMANVGAGMVLFSREGAETVLDFYRNGSYAQYRFWPLYFTGLVPPTPHEVPDPNGEYQMTADWFFESSLMSRQLATIACTPTMARSLDQTDEVLQLEPTEQGGPRVRLNDTPALLGNYEPASNTFTAQPHQIFIALPDAFQGAWKIIWEKHNGPFGMKTTGGSLSLPVYGTVVSFLLDVKEGSRVDFHVDGAKVTEWSGGRCYYAVKFVGDVHHVKLDFTGEVTVMTTVFVCPQNWFKDGYGLRYAHLQKYL